MFSYARGFAPCIPATEPGRHWFDFKKPIQFGVAGERRLQSIKIREKFLGVWGLLPRSPQALPRPLHPRGLNPGGTGSTLRNRFFWRRRKTPVAVNKNFEKSSWGFGGFFQEAPKRFPAPRIPGAEPGRHWLDFKKPILFGVAGERRLQSIKIREKFLGVWGLLSRSPQRFSNASPTLQQAQKIRCSIYKGVRK